MLELQQSDSEEESSCHEIEELTNPLQSKMLQVQQIKQRLGIDGQNTERQPETKGLTDSLGSSNIPPASMKNTYQKMI